MVNMTPLYKIGLIFPVSMAIVPMVMQLPC